ncbi:MAG TPA: EpsG family protein [Allosphingosinicella sp.]|nr:EpsG family protein [Allosphingosinicella sp.]
MLPYWILFSLFAAGAVQFRPLPNRAIQGGLLFLILATATMLMVGLRYQVGADWDTYDNILDDITRMDFFTGIWNQDPAYGALNWLAGRAGLGIWAVNLVCAFLFTWGLVRFARRQPHPWLVILVAIPYLIIVAAMGYTRQAVAIGFVLMALAEFDTVSIPRFLFYIFLAATFHKTAIIVLPMAALTITRGRMLTTAVLLLSTILLYYVFVQSSVDKLMTNYEGSDYDSQGAGIRVAMNVVPAFIYLVFWKRFGFGGRSLMLWRNFSFAAFLSVALLMLTSSSTAVDRMALYLIPLQLAVFGRLPWVLSANGMINRRIILVLIFYSAAIQFVWLNFAKHAQYWVPYHTVLAPPPA